MRPLKEYPTGDSGDVRTLTPMRRVSAGSSHWLPRNQGPSPHGHGVITSTTTTITTITTSTTITTTTTTSNASLNTSTPYGQQHLYTRPPPEHEGHVLHRYPEVVLTDEPVFEEPIVEEPVFEKPIVEEPIVEEPIVEEPIFEKPIVEEPVFEEPIVEEPVFEEPIVEEPVVEEPIIEEPVFEEPIVEEPIVDEPVFEEPIVEEPVFEEPIVEEPIVEEPVFEEPIVEEPVFEEPIVEEPIIEEPVVKEPIFEEPVFEEPIVEEPIIEEPIVEEPIVEEPVFEEPIVEEPVFEEPIVEEPVLEEPIVEEPIVEEPVFEEPIIEEPVVEEPIVEEPVVEEPVIEEPVVEESVHCIGVQENRCHDIPSPVNREPQFITSPAITPLDTMSYELPTVNTLFIINDMVPSRPVLSKLPVQRYGFPSEEMFDYPDRYAHTCQLPPQYPLPQQRQQFIFPPQPQQQQYGQQARLPQNHQYFEQPQHPQYPQHYSTEPQYLQHPQQPHNYSVYTEYTHVQHSQPTQTSPLRYEQQSHEISQPQLPPFEGYPSQHPQCRDTVIVDERGVRIYPAIFQERQYGTQAQVPIFSESAVVPLEAIQAAQDGAASSRNNGWSLFIYNLIGSTDDKDLYELFSPYAPIVSCAVVKYENTNTCRGFGFVVMPYFNIAYRAIQELNLSMYNGQVIQVSFKKHKEAKQENHQ